MQPQITVRTFREGLLSALGHDLQLRLERFELELLRRQVRFRGLANLRVEGAMKQGRLDPSVPANSDKTKIEQTIREDILQVARFPEITYSGEARSASGEFLVAGELTLRGIARSTPLRLRVGGGALSGRVEFPPTRFGIAPYRALGGALKLQDRVEVHLQLPFDPELASSWEELELRWQCPLAQTG